MNVNGRRSFTMGLALLALTGSSADADMTCKMLVTVDPAQLKTALSQLQPVQRKEVLANPVFQQGGCQMTFRVSGTKTRMDFPKLGDVSQMSIIKGTQAGKVFLVLGSAKRYMVEPADFDTQPVNTGIDAQVTRIQETQTFLGHPAQKYTLAITTPTGTETGEIWAAPDLPALPSGAFVQSPLISGVWSKVHGMPMKMTMTLDLPSPVTLDYRLLSFSAQPIPVSVFSLPKGFTRLEVGGAAPGK